ncbi:hypothetical protein [Lentzea jiangxiensis]|uniref:Uncharacterized protein n=1 Tax=Lentzea jiangxiensis TaxID=641025 RepID=A0A1H0K0H6_9PSEU|nr:hypothetical protein [Lentzea jiangxiensis]SDO49548.1 hypothetical protein SAMN05421507_102712 [Lentzea jiangxiensis]
MLNVDDKSTSVRTTAQFRFLVPRMPFIRLWALKTHYVEAPYITDYGGTGGCLRVKEYAESSFSFETDRYNSGAWATSEVTDFEFLLQGTKDAPVEAWINVSLGKGEPPKYTVYAYDDGTSAGTVFGPYIGPGMKPKAFPDGGDNYFAEMTDLEGNWLWLYRLYAPAS